MSESISQHSKRLTKPKTACKGCGDTRRLNRRGECPLCETCRGCGVLMIDVGPGTMCNPCMNERSR